MRIAVFEKLVPGGAWRAFEELTKGLTKNHTIDIYTFFFNNEACPNIGVSNNIFKFKVNRLYLRQPFGFLNMFMNFINLYLLDRLYLKISKIIDSKKYTAVVVHAGYYDYIHTPGLLRFLRTPKIYFCQEPFHRYFEYDPFQKPWLSFNIKSLFYLFNIFLSKIYRYVFYLYDRINIRHADLVLCNSFYTREYIRKEYSISAQVNYLGVDADRFRPLGLERQNLILSVGHLTYRKSHHFVLEAIERLDPRIRPTLVIINFPVSPNDFYKKYIKNLALRKNVEILFYENISDDELILLYNKAKLTACAYRNEPFGLVILESLACATPVVAVKEGGIPEIIIDHQTGILVKRDIRAFSSAIDYLLKEDLIREKMGENARKDVLERWTWQRSVKDLENNLYSLLKEKR